MKIEVLASMVHEANRAYCTSIEQYITAPWDLEPIIIQNSIIDGIKNIAANPGMTPSQSHDSWLQYKAAEGWVYGEIKDVEKKTHPCMVAYSDLPEYEKIKDRIFGSLVKEFLDELEYDEEGGGKHIRATANIETTLSVNS